MKTPFDAVTGRIVDYDERTNELLIRAKYDDYLTLSKRQYRECKVQLIDGRTLSDKQRRACYALLRYICDYSGMDVTEAKEFTKIRFLAENIEDTADKIFSLSDAPMSLVCAYQRFLVRFIISNDIPCDKPLLNFVDDIQDYIYSCLIHKKCCVCGKHTQLHHVDRVGMGRDRAEIIHIGMKVLPLCAEHHGEDHMMGEDSFQAMYHLTDGIEVDRTIAKIYGLKAK